MTRTTSTVLPKLLPILLAPVLVGCSGAEIDFEPVVTLDFTDAPSLPIEGGFFAATPGLDRFAFVNRRIPAVVMIFDGEGRYVGSVGEGGEERGQNMGIRALAFDTAGSLWTFHGRDSRADVFDAELRYRRTVDLPESLRVREAFGLDDGRIFFYGRGRLEAAGWTVGPSGLTRPMTVSPYAGELPGPIKDVPVTTDGASRVWDSRIYDYLVREWTLEESGSSVSSSYSLDPAWFDGRFPYDVLERFGARLDTAGASLTSLGYDPDHEVLWVTGGTPASNVDVDEVGRFFTGQRQPDERQLANLLGDQIIDAIDLTTGERIASRRFDRVEYVLKGPLAYRVVMDELGKASIEISRPVVR